MAMRIVVEDCINCAACEEDCPTESISKGEDAFTVNAETCTECEDEYPEPKCEEMCPIDGCVVKAETPHRR